MMAHRLRWQKAQDRLNELNRFVHASIQAGQLPDDFLELVTTLRKIAPRLTTPELNTFVDFLLGYLKWAQSAREPINVDTLNFLLFGESAIPDDDQEPPKSHPC